MLIKLNPYTISVSDVLMYKGNICKVMQITRNTNDVGVFVQTGIDDYIHVFKIQGDKITIQKVILEDNNVDVTEKSVVSDDIKQLVGIRKLMLHLFRKLLGV